MTGEIARTKEIVDIVTSSPQSRRKRCPSDVPMMQRSGVLVSLGVGLPSVEGERSHLVPLLFSIVGKQRKGIRDGS
jgi:hypothetical protein